ncbi:MAG TPA: HAMP domain-containing sensor histidine kinase [Candidatus Saccharimonadales bacterium]|nr:HAMP domain-containing sensor histidine kinase [Candidatus Saccharimonadales bacterium]
MKGLQNKASSVDVLVAAAHELKAPLVLMRHLVQTLGGHTVSPEEQRRCIERLAFTTDRMIRLTQHLTVSYRLGTSHNLHFDLVPINASLVCEQALHEMTPYAAAHGQNLQFESKKKQLVLAEQDILHDILINLIDNAIRHNTNGDNVVVGTLGRKDHVRLQVHDNGHGVRAAELSALSENIGSRPQLLSTRAGTSGLGLYIVSQLAQAMGGGLGLGRARQGTTFFVDLMRSRQLQLL